MNVLFITSARIHDINERGIYTDLIRKFRNSGHNLYVVFPYERYLNRNTECKFIDGIHMLGVKTLNIQKTNVFEKLFSTIFLEFYFKRAIKRNWSNKKFDLLIYTTPPITFTNLISWLKQKFDCTSYLLLKDIFPQNAVDLGLMSTRWIFYRYFKLVENKLYRLSDYIGCMSPANCKYIEKCNVPLYKIEENPNSIEINNISNMLSEDIIFNIKSKYNIPQNTTIFLYAGNFGKPQSVEFIIKVLESNIQFEDRFFVLVGSGTEFYQLQDWFVSRSPLNVKLISQLNKQEYDMLAASCDVGLIFLDHRFTIPNFPSRLLSYLENSMPVITCTDYATDIGDIVSNNGFGLSSHSDNLEQINACIDYFVNNSDRIEEMGRQGYKYLVDNFNVDLSYRKIINHFEYV